MVEANYGETPSVSLGAPSLDKRAYKGYSRLMVGLSRCVVSRLGRRGWKSLPNVDVAEGNPMWGAYIGFKCEASLQCS
jgi:hypothetical protein